VLCFDADAAGQKAAERSLDALLQNDLIIRVAEMPAGEDPDSLIRKKGREEFETRVRNAQDFFDYWIEREADKQSLDSLGARMQLARTLAQTVGHVHDSFMRGQVMSKASARLGVPTAEFEALVPKTSREGFTPRENAPPAGTILPPQGMAMLCLLALRDPEAREYLQAQPWKETLAEADDGELLIRILEADLHPDDPASITSFMAGLSAEDEALVSFWVRQTLTENGIVQKYPLKGLEVAKGWWNGLRRASLVRQVQTVKDRMRLPQTTPGEVLHLQKEILDLQEQLRDVSQLLPARILDN
jgi:DNA primase